MHWSIDKGLKWNEWNYRALSFAQHRPLPWVDQWKSCACGDGSIRKHWKNSTFIYLIESQIDMELDEDSVVHYNGWPPVCIFCYTAYSLLACKCHLMVHLPTPKRKVKPPLWWKTLRRYKSIWSRSDILGDINTGNTFLNGEDLRVSSNIGSCLYFYP